MTVVQEIYTIVPKIGHNVGRPLGHMLSTDNLTTISKFKLHMQIDLDKRMNPLYFHDHETQPPSIGKQVKYKILFDKTARRNSKQLCNYRIFSPRVGK